MLRKQQENADGLIKSLITNTVITINQKGVDAFQIASYHRFLMTTNKNSLISLKEKINGNESQAIFKVDITLANNSIEISPKINVIQEAINKLAKSILYAMKGISSWKKLDSNEIVSFHTKIGKDNEIIKMII